MPSAAACVDAAALVNISRGDLVDDEALIAALASRRLRAARLDVFANEPRVHPGYRTLDNMFLTPHMAVPPMRRERRWGAC